MKLNVFVSTTRDGIMSQEKKYFPKLTKEEREVLYKNTLSRFFSKRGLNGEDAVIITEKNMTYSAKTATNDNKKYKDQVIVLKEATPYLPVCVETSDSPIIVASAKDQEGKNVCAVALGTIKNINDNVLNLMVDTLMKETDAAPFEMTFFIGACPSKENYQLDSIEELTNPLWKNTYEKKKKKYYLDIRYAIFNQLLKEIVDPNCIYFDSNDTVENNDYYSDFTDKKGKHLACVVYTDEEV